MKLTDKIVEFNLTQEDLAVFNSANIAFDEISSYLEDFYYPTIWEKLLRKFNVIKSPLRNKETSANSILTLFDHGIPPSLAGKYAPRFNADEILFLYERGFPLNLASSYAERFSVADISVLGEHFCPPEKAELYHTRFNGGEIAYMLDSGCIPEVANRFSHDFNGVEIAIILIQNAISGRSGELMKSLCPEIISARKNFSFSNKEYTLLSIWGIPSIKIPKKKQKEMVQVMRTALVQLSIWGLENQARKPDNRKRLDELSRKLRFSPEDLLITGPLFPKEHFSKILSEVTKELVVDTKRMLQQYNFLGIGAHSLVVLDRYNSSAYKFSRTGRNEAELLYKLAAVPNQINTIKIKKTVYLGEVDILELEYVLGKSLHQVLNERHTPSVNKVLNYSFDIFNGLLEMRQAGIWHHRDLRPANIMIDEEKDRAVIIDLGIATTDKDALAEDNRRFGSPSGRRANDLNSLGQVVYKMAAGEHIFTESRSMERTTYADDLRDHRDWIYEQAEERLPPYLRRVEETVQDSGLCGIVKFCLESKGTEEDYKTLEARFKEYGP